jgi:hypothetical protein
MAGGNKNEGIYSGFSVSFLVQLYPKVPSHFSFNRLPDGFESDPVHALPCPIRRPIGVWRIGRGPRARRGCEMRQSLLFQ